MLNRTLAMVVTVAVVALLASSVQAGVAGYWRFEDSPGYLEDSGSNNLDLTQAGSGTSQYTLPLSGRGQYFDKTIPQTGAANAEGAWVGDADDGYFYCGDPLGSGVSSLTIEAYVNKDTVSTGTQIIAAQYRTTGNQRSWSFGVAGSNQGVNANRLYLGWGTDGTYGTIAVVHSGIEIGTDTDYFVAASFDGTQTTGGVKFYIKNLSTGVWTTVTKNRGSGELFNSTANLEIGSSNGGNSQWTGLLDEVRLVGYRSVSRRPAGRPRARHDGPVGDWWNRDCFPPAKKITR